MFHSCLALGAPGVGADRRRTIGNNGSKGVLMFKRVTYVLLSLAFVLTLVACGGKKEEEEEEEAPKAAATTAASAPSAASAAPAAGGATITGKVAFTGTAPAKEQIKMDADAYCKGAHAEPVYTQDVVVNRNGTLHNIHALPKINAEFNIGQPFQKMETIKKFDKAEMPVRFKCDVHKWMGAYCGVFNHPFFATTNEQGSFDIKNLPPGNYVIEAWQEKYGAQTQNVTVAGSETKTIDFSFKG